MEAEDTLAAALKFPSGALGVIEAATSAWPGDDLQIEIVGENGSATIVNDKITRWDFSDKQVGDEDALKNEAAGRLEAAHQTLKPSRSKAIADSSKISSSHP
jgi:predicted dehydrogenase